MKARKWMVAGMAACLAAGAQAKLVNRYMFNGNVNDAVGTINGNPTAAAANLEAPQYATDIPAGGVAAAPTQSIKVGMDYGAKKSGFVLNKNVISTNTGSFSTWLKADAMANGRYMVFSVLLPDGPTLMGQSAATVKVIAGDEQSPVLSAFTTGAWHHVAATWDNPNGLLSFYMDGVLAGTTNFTPNSMQPTQVRIGGFDLSDNANQLGNQYEGRYYDLQFYDSMLDADEVSRLYAYPGSTIGDKVAASNTAALVHRYVFDNSVEDAVGVFNGTPTVDGTNTEAVAYSAATPPGTVPGAPSTSLDVGMNYGTKKSGFVINSAIINTNAGAYSLWMKADAMANGRYVFAPLPLTAGPILFGQSATSIRMVAGAERSPLDAPFTTGIWHHVAASWDNAAGEVYFFLDGALAGSTNFTPGSIAPTTVRVGGFNLADDAANLANQYQGLLYDVQVYNNMLGSDDVFSLYANPGLAALAFTSSGVPYSWLATYYPGLETAEDYENAANNDTDGDGFTGYEEWRTGTDPTDPGSFFAFTGAKVGGGGFVVTWPSVEGELYTLSTNASLIYPQWGAVASDIVGQANETSYTTTVGGAAGFYKIELPPLE